MVALTVYAYDIKEDGWLYFTARISKGLGEGETVLTIKADDADIGDNAAIKYSLVSNPGGHFKINEDTGVIAVNSLQNLTSAVSNIGNTWVTF